MPAIEGNFRHMKESLVTGRKFLLHEGHSCTRKEFPVTGRKFLTQEGNSCTGRNFLPHEVYSF